MSSRRDLAGLVSQGAFRDDFFYRIDVVSVRLPRLRERPEDVLPLARAFARRAARAWDRPARRFTDAAEKTLQRHPWPGNVRELQHVVEKAVLAAEAADIEATDLPAGSLGSAGNARRRRAGEPLDAQRADGRLHLGDAAPRGRESLAGGAPAGRLAKVSLGERAEIKRETPR